MSLRYPQDRPQGLVDFVTFTHEKYTGGGGGGGAPIVLYHPEDSPAISNANSWSDSGNTFSGPLGKFKRGLVGGGVEIAEGKYGNASEITGTVTKALEKLKGGDGMGAAARHYAMERGADALGMTANQMLSVERGEIFNPNVELFYNGPQLRKFTFTFLFTPKSSGDARAAMEIIKEFKKWSAPADVGAKYEIPHVWKIKYSNKNYNKFKRAALLNVSVDYNTGMDQHMTFIDDMPISTSLSLSFMEAEMVTRKDHNSGSGF